MPAAKGLYSPEQQAFLDVLDSSVKRDEPDFDFIDSIMAGQRVMRPYDLVMEIEGRRLYAASLPGQKNWLEVLGIYLDKGFLDDTDELSNVEQETLQLVQRNLDGRRGNGI